MMCAMSLSRRAMRRSPLSLSFTRDRADGGGGDDDGENFDDGPGAGATDRQRRAAAGDDEDEDDGSDDDGSDDDGEDDDEKLREEGKRALDAERQKVKDLRKQLREAKKGTSSTDAPKDGKPSPDVERARLDGESAAVATWKPLVVNTAAAGKLAAAGLVGSPERLVKMLDLDEIDVDPTDGSIDGLDEQISDLKKDYPMLFRRTTGRRLDSADRGERNRKPKDATELQAEQLRSGGF